MDNQYRELTARELQAIHKLVTSECANFDYEYGCLPLDEPCYMFTIAYVNSSLCKYPYKRVSLLAVYMTQY